MENPIKIDDLEVPLFLETPFFTYIKSKLLAKKTYSFSNALRVFTPRVQILEAPFLSYHSIRLILELGKARSNPA